MLMTSLHLALLLSILLCSLVAGLLFGFAVVVMPGIAKLSDKEFLSSFKHMDGIIQDNQPLFILVWAGSILSVISTLILGTLNLDGTELYLLWIASILYLFGVQIPTFGSTFLSIICCKTWMCWLQKNLNSHHFVMISKLHGIVGTD